MFYALKCIVLFVSYAKRVALKFLYYVLILFQHKCCTLMNLYLPKAYYIDFSIDSFTVHLHFH